MSIPSLKTYVGPHIDGGEILAAEVVRISADDPDCVVEVAIDGETIYQIEPHRWMGFDDDGSPSPHEHDLTKFDRFRRAARDKGQMLRHVIAAVYEAGRERGRMEGASKWKSA